jgi:putative glutathione S-transferase
MGRNMLVDGEWQTDIEPYTDDAGAFDRVETSFRETVRAESGARFQPEPDRYHLYIARNCPWAHGAALTRRLMGLSDTVSMDIVDPHREDDGWRFSPAKEGCTADSIHMNTARMPSPSGVGGIASAPSNNH